MAINYYYYFFNECRQIDKRIRIHDQLVGQRAKEVKEFQLLLRTNEIVLLHIRFR